MVWNIPSIPTMSNTEENFPSPFEGGMNMGPAANDDIFRQHELGSEIVIEGVLDDVKRGGFERGIELSKALGAFIEAQNEISNERLGPDNGSEQLVSHVALSEFISGFLDGIAMQGILSPIEILGSVARGMKLYARDSGVTDDHWMFGDLSDIYVEPDYGSAALPELSQETGQAIFDACEAARERVLATGTQETHFFEDCLVVFEKHGDIVRTWLGFESVDTYLARRFDIEDPFTMRSEVIEHWSLRPDVFDACCPSGAHKDNVLLFNRQIFENSGLLMPVAEYLVDESDHDTVSPSLKPKTVEVQTVVVQGQCFGYILILRSKEGAICSTLNVHIAPEMQWQAQNGENEEGFFLEHEADGKRAFEICAEIVEERGLSMTLVNSVDLDICAEHRHMIPRLNDDDLNDQMIKSFNT